MDKKRPAQAKKGLVVFINGSPGTGKSTLAIKLADRLNVDTILQTDLLKEMWKSGRVENNGQSYQKECTYWFQFTNQRIQGYNHSHNKKLSKCWKKSDCGRGTGYSANIQRNKN